MDTMCNVLGSCNAVPKSGKAQQMGSLGRCCVTSRVGCSMALAESCEILRTIALCMLQRHGNNAAGTSFLARSCITVADRSRDRVLPMSKSEQFQITIGAGVITGTGAAPHARRLLGLRRPILQSSISKSRAWDADLLDASIAG